MGLKNQGATCYMNSLLQYLYHLPYFRKVSGWKQQQRQGRRGSGRAAAAGAADAAAGRCVGSRGSSSRSSSRGASERQHQRKRACSSIIGSISMGVIQR